MEWHDRMSWPQAVIALVGLIAMLDGCDQPRTVAADRPSTATLRAELTAFEQRWSAATIARNRAALDSLMAPEWTITLTDGQRSDKARAIAHWTAPLAPDVLREASSVDTVEVRSLGPDAAVVTAAITDVEVHATSADTARTRVTDVVIRRDGRWQVIVSHESVRPSAQPPSGHRP